MRAELLALLGIIIMLLLAMEEEGADYTYFSRVNQTPRELLIQTSHLLLEGNRVYVLVEGYLFIIEGEDVNVWETGAQGLMENNGVWLVYPHELVSLTGERKEVEGLIKYTRGRLVLFRPFRVGEKVKRDYPANGCVVIDNTCIPAFEDSVIEGNWVISVMRYPDEYDYLRAALKYGDVSRNLALEVEKKDILSLKAKGVEFVSRARLDEELWEDVLQSHGKLVREGWKVFTVVDNGDPYPLPGEHVQSNEHYVVTYVAGEYLVWTLENKPGLVGRYEKRPWLIGENVVEEVEYNVLPVEVWEEGESVIIYDGENSYIEWNGELYRVKGRVLYVENDVVLSDREIVWLKGGRRIDIWEFLKHTRVFKLEEEMIGEGP